MATRFPDDDAGDHTDIDDLDDADTAIDAGGDDQGDDDQEGEDIVFAGDDQDDDTAPDLPKKLRNEIKERDRALALANKRIAELDKPAAPVDVGPRPTREEHDWDDEAYDAAVDAWNERKMAAQTQASQPNDSEAEARQDVDRMHVSIASLSQPDAKDVVAGAVEVLSPADQFIIARVVKEPGKLIYALGKNPARLKTLMEITDPVKKIAEITRMEMQMTTRTRTAPQPEHIRTGDARPGGGADKQLAKLEAEAEKTGDRTALIRYRKEQEAKKKA